MVASLSATTDTISGTNNGAATEGNRLYCVLYFVRFVVTGRNTRIDSYGDNWSPAVTWATYTGENVRVTAS